MADVVKAWLPWEDPDGFLGGVCRRGTTWTTTPVAERPKSLDEVEFYVPSYMGGGDVVDVVATCRR